MPATIVRGEVVLTPALGTFRNARLHVLLLDVTLADAPATTLARSTISPVDYDATADRALPFALPPCDWEAGRTIQVFAHLDRSGNGDIEVGDALTTVAHPVSGPSGDPAIRLHLTTVAG